MITLGYNIVNKTPKPLAPIYTPKLSALIMKFLEKNPHNRPKISDILDYFPYQAKSGKESKETMWPALSNFNPPKNDKIEIVHIDSAKLLKVVEEEKKKSKEDEKQLKNGNNLIVNIQNNNLNSHLNNLNNVKKLKFEQELRFTEKDDKIIVEPQKQNNMNSILKIDKFGHSREINGENSAQQISQESIPQDLRLINQVISITNKVN